MKLNRKRPRPEYKIFKDYYESKKAKRKRMEVVCGSSTDQTCKSIPMRKLLSEARKLHGCIVSEQRPKEFWDSLESQGLPNEYQEFSEIEIAMIIQNINVGNFNLLKEIFCYENLNNQYFTANSPCICWEGKKTRAGYPVIHRDYLSGENGECYTFKWEERHDGNSKNSAFVDKFEKRLDSAWFWSRKGTDSEKTQRYEKHLNRYVRASNEDTSWIHCSKYIRRRMNPKDFCRLDHLIYHHYLTFRFAMIKRMKLSASTYLSLNKNQEFGILDTHDNRSVHYGIHKLCNSKKCINPLHFSSQLLSQPITPPPYYITEYSNINLHDIHWCGSTTSSDDSSQNSKSSSSLVLDLRPYFKHYGEPDDPEKIVYIDVPPSTNTNSSSKRDLSS